MKALDKLKRLMAGREAGAAPSKLPPVERPNIDLVVGLDFGTSSTKVVLGDHVHDHSYWLDLDDRMQGIPPGASPTSVRIAYGRITFGTRAEKESAGTCYRRAKVELTSPGRDAPFRQRDGRYSESCEVVSALYLAWLIDRIRSQVHTTWPDHEIRLSWNVPVPLSETSADPTQVERERRERFERVVYAALKLADDPPRQNAEFAPLRRRTADELQRYSPLELNQLGATVLPEPLAPVMAFQRSRFLPPGLYVIIDVGAGSTEVSVFRHVAGDEGREVFYADGTTLVGGDDLAMATSRRVRRGTSVARLGDRMSLDDLPELRERLRQVRVDQNSSLERVTKHIRLAYQSTWGRGFEKEKNQSAWERVTVHLIGGGSRHAGVTRALLEPAIAKMTPWDTDRFRWPVTPFDPSAALHPIGRPQELADLGDDATLFTVALGLATHALDYPDFDTPGSLDPVQEKIRGRHRSRDERYPK